MILSPSYSVAIIAIMTLITFALRSAPFVLFSRSGTTPKVITYLGYALPPSVIGMLIIYCIRHVSIMQFSFGLPEFIAIIVVVILHLWKQNNLLSILGSTVFYMVLVQVIFV